MLMAQTFDTNAFFTDNRIMDAAEALRDRYNPAIRIHPADLSDDKVQRTYERLYAQMGLPEPSIFGDPLKAKIFDAALQITAHDVPPITEAAGNASMPFATMVQAEAPVWHSVDFSQAQAEAFNVYALLDAYVTLTGNSELALPRLQDLAASLPRPSLVDVGDALADITGMNGRALASAVAAGGAAQLGVALGIEDAYCQELQQLSAYLSEHGFSLNDLANWSVGRGRVGMLDAPIEQQIEIGRQARAMLDLGDMAAQLSSPVNCDYSASHHQDIKAALDAVPPALSALFFDMNGSIIFNADCGNKDKIHTRLEGQTVFHENHAEPAKSVNIKYISANSSTEEMQLTLIHELHHNFFPNYIPTELIAEADAMIARDNKRIVALYKLSNQLLEAMDKGTLEDQAIILDAINSYSVDGQPTFAALVEQVPLQQIIEVIDNAYRYVRLDSDLYDNVGAYEDPAQLSKEIIPRYAEIRFALEPYSDAVAAFVMPELTGVYDGIFMPHIEAKLQDVQMQKTKELQQPDTYATNISYDLPIMPMETRAQAL
jgi:hypothetical protein